MSGYDNSLFIVVWPAFPNRRVLVKLQQLIAVMCKMSLLVQSLF